MTENPYKAPEAPQAEIAATPLEWWLRFAPGLGCLGGGCLFPVLFVFAALALATGDTDSPIFILPLIAIFTGPVGLVIGCIVRNIAVRRHAKKSARSNESSPDH